MKPTRNTRIFSSRVVTPDRRNRRARDNRRAKVNIVTVIVADATAVAAGIISGATPGEIITAAIALVARVSRPTVSSVRVSRAMDNRVAKASAIIAVDATETAIVMAEAAASIGKTDKTVTAVASSGIIAAVDNIVTAAANVRALNRSRPGRESAPRSPASSRSCSVKNPKLN